MIGKGISFGLKKGDLIDQAKIERRFITTEEKESLLQLKELSAKTLDLTTQVIALIEPKLQLTFSDFQYLALADHIDFALARSQEKLDLNTINNAWEVRNLFFEEYQVALQVIAFIEEKTGQTLPKSEAILLTYHFVNAASDSTKVQETVQLTRLIQQIVRIVSYEYELDLDQHSFNYSRFVSHLRTLLVRLLKEQHGASATLDPALLTLMQTKYQRAYQTSEHIASFLATKMGWHLGSDDLIYLTLHIFRVTSRKEDLSDQL